MADADSAKGIAEFPVHVVAIAEKHGGQHPALIAPVGEYRADGPDPERINVPTDASRKGR